MTEQSAAAIRDLRAEFEREARDDTVNPWIAVAPHVGLALLDEVERLREALERVLPLVVYLSEVGWVKGAEATAIIREGLNG